jgi:hypothetical protein
MQRRLSPVATADAAVQQRSMADITFVWSRLTCPALPISWSDVA